MMLQHAQAFHQRLTDHGWPSTIGLTLQWRDEHVELNLPHTDRSAGMLYKHHTYLHYGRTVKTPSVEPFVAEGYALIEQFRSSGLQALAMGGGLAVEVGQDIVIHTLAPHRLKTGSSQEWIVPLSSLPQKQWVLGHPLHQTHHDRVQTLSRLDKHHPTLIFSELEITNRWITVPYLAYRHGDVAVFLALEHHIRADILQA